MAKARILVVDDDESILKVCAATLNKLPEAEIILESQSSRAAGRLAEESFDLLIADICMPEVDGVQLLRIARDHDPNLAVLMFTGFPTVETAVESMKLGAADYIAKPFPPKTLLATVGRLLQKTERLTERHSEALDGLRQAMQIELEGMKLFGRAAEITQDPKGKEIFLRFAEIEVGHYQLLEAEYEALSQISRWLSYEEAHQVKVGQPFPQAILDDQKVLQQIREGTGDLEALEIAIDLERRAYSHFRQAAGRVEDPLAKEVFLRLAAEEETHGKLFEAEYDYVARSGFYFDIREFSPELS